MKLTASKFRRLLDRASHARDSIASCVGLAEIQTCGAALADVTAELQIASLRRASAELEHERVNMLATIDRVAMFRLAQVREIRAAMRRERDAVGL